MMVHHFGEETSQQESETLLNRGLAQYKQHEGERLTDDHIPFDSCSTVL